MQIVFKTEARFLDKHLRFLEQVLVGTFKQRSNPAYACYEPRYSFLPIEPIGGRFSLSAETGAIASPELMVSTKLSSRLKTVVQDVINYLLGALMLSASVLLIIFYGPSLYYAVFPSRAVDKPSDLGVLIAEGYKAEAEAKFLEKVAQEEELANLAYKQPARYLPDQDPNLPEGDWLIIPLIGVHTPLQKTLTAEEALDTGVWMVPDFGEPGQLNMPMIVSGHRYGWKWWWQSNYWRYHSFYKLPELQPGDKVEIISDQRKWTYEVYAGEEGEEITDYQADLILYTCKFLNNPLRVFRYAKLVI